jgi:hypothetical protein
MRKAAERFFGLMLPALLNAGLAGWIVWKLVTGTGYPRGIGFGVFVWFYGIGGLAILLSCASAFLLLATESPGSAGAVQRRRWLMLALINTTIPSVLILALLLFR